ncbi:choice-of-anchor P family protein [Amycolatopsis cynarae]|uniref:Choice-of-anchor P family protein n=1 Tax=Amycolatopsis cynarae TaxID=2995223 RepID=A0ABY7B5K1_9PSEU|nr:choice-of-anchor P family protein [Amycolatopsis sp. HUAS 11-8]WAL66068.1 choice-of-anchor P family protein [Amycolatopsis sp. HUAS 11-8]
MSRKKAVAGGIGALSALLVTGAVLAPAAGATTTTGHSTASSGGNSAFAVSASGLLHIDPSPAVDDSNGFSQASLVKAQVPPALLGVGALNAQAGGGGAQASVAKLGVGLGPAKPLVNAAAIEAQCGYGEKPHTSLAKAAIGDIKLDVQVPANTSVSVPGLLSVTLNKQVKHKDGSITVTAISIQVDNVQKIDIASAHCGPDGDDDNGGGDGGTPTGTPTGAPGQPSGTPTRTSTSKPSATVSSGNAAPAGDKALPNGKAPTPTPVKAHLDVTG